MNFDNLLSEQLSDIAEDAAPVSSIDSGRTIVQAQRIRLRRRTAGAGTTLAVLGLATGLGFTLTGGSAAIAPAVVSADAPAETSQAASASPTAHPSAVGIDPLTMDAHFGTLASPLAATSLSVSDSGLQQIEATDESTGTTFTVTLGDAGFAPDPTMGYPQAPDVNGGRASWDEAGSLGHLSGVPDSLAWQYSPNGWADLMFDQATASKTELEEIAGAVHFGSTAVPMPVSLPSVSGFTLGKAASLSYTAGEPEAGDDHAPGDRRRLHPDHHRLPLRRPPAGCVFPPPAPPPHPRPRPSSTRTATAYTSTHTSTPTTQPPWPPRPACSTRPSGTAPTRTTGPRASTDNPLTPAQDQFPHVGALSSPGPYGNPCHQARTCRHPYQFRAASGNIGTGPDVSHTPSP